MSKVYVVPEKSPLPENDGPPTIATPYGLCGRCGKQSRFKEKEQFLLAHGEPYRCAVTSHNATSKMILFYCRNCLQGIIEIEEVFANNQRVKRLGHTSGRRIWKGTYWWPQAQILAHESVPDGIKEAFAEAANCFQSGYYRASAVMSRRTLEAVVEDHEIECKNLYDGIKQLVESERLSTQIEKWSQEVRLIGADSTPKRNATRCWALRFGNGRYRVKRDRVGGWDWKPVSLTAA